MSANSLPNSDAELIRQSRKGDETAYGQVVQKYQSLVCSVAYNRCGDLTLSEDLAQEAFIQAWKKLADLSDATKFKSWICTIVRNLASRTLEKSSRNVAAGATRLDAVVEPASAATDPIENIISAEQEKLVWQALAGIPENYREPMILFYREDQSVVRVAEALEISTDAVKQRLSRGRKFLQEQLAITVETTLKNSKPSKAFTGAVILGLAGAKAKTATAGATASVTAKATAGSSFGGMFFMFFAKLPLMAWLLKTSLDESRSSRERQLMARQIFFCVLGLIPMMAIMFGTIPWQNKVQAPLGGLIVPGIMVLYFIPMLYSFRRLGKRIEQLRIEENTDTPLRAIVSDQGNSGSTTRLFVGSGLLIAIWPAVMPVIAGDWIGVGLPILSALAISLTGAYFCGKQPTRSFRVYGACLGGITLTGIGLMYFRQANWAESFSNHTLLHLGMMQGSIITQVILTAVVWRRVYGKPR